MNFLFYEPWLSTALIVYGAENVGFWFYVQKCTVCDFQSVKSAQLSDITYTGKFRTVNDAQNLTLLCMKLG